MLFVMGSLGVPRHTQVPREYVQRTVLAAAAATSVSTGEHDGTNDDAKPNCPTVHDATDADGRTGTDAK